MRYTAFLLSDLLIQFWTGCYWLLFPHCCLWLIHCSVAIACRLYACACVCINYIELACAPALVSHRFCVRITFVLIHFNKVVLSHIRATLK